MPLDDQIYPAQVWTIQELEGSYTIVGRGANRVLEGYEDLLNLFICTAPNIRLKRVEEGYGVPAAQAEKLGYRDGDKYTQNDGVVYINGFDSPSALNTFIEDLHGCVNRSEAMAAHQREER